MLSTKREKKQSYNEYGPQARNFEGGGVKNAKSNAHLIYENSLLKNKKLLAERQLPSQNEL